MQPIVRRIVKKTGYLLLLLGLCGMGIFVALSRSEKNIPKEIQPSAKVVHSDVMFVLDAGHGELTYTKSLFHRIFDVFIIAY